MTKEERLAKRKADMKRIQKNLPISKVKPRSLLTEIQALRRKLGGLEKRAKGNFGSVNRKTTGKKSEMVSPYTSKSKRKSPGRPTMTSMGAKKLKPRNTDTTKRPTRPSGPSMTSMGAKAPKPRNKNVTKRPTRPSKQGSFGR